MRKYWLAGMLAAIALVVIAGVSSAVSKKSSFAKCTSKNEVSLRLTMRNLWDDHNAWTKMYIDSAVAGLPDKDVVAERLLRNQEYIGNAIKPYYGKAAGDRLTALLKEHIGIAGELVAAAKISDKSKVADAEKRWNANAEEIVAFLHKANPKYWPKEELSGMMKAHLEVTEQMATADIGKDYKGEVSAYDRSRDHVLMMADILSEGIINQFPKEFKFKKVFCG